MTDDRNFDFKCTAEFQQYLKNNNTKITVSPNCLNEIIRMNSFRIPTIPNSPLNSTDDPQDFGFMRLRLNSHLNFVENAEFESSRATYDKNYQNNQSYSNFFILHMQNVIELLKKEFPRGSRIVEVGCGKGSFVELIEADGYFEITGYDATYEGTSISIQKRYLNPSDRLDADIIVLRHVLEHIPSPHSFVAMLKGIFGKGKIYIEVPNYDWIADNQAFFDVTYEHVNYFSQQSLRMLFKDSESKSGIFFGDQYQYLIADIGSLSTNFSDLYNGKEWKELDFELLFPNIAERISSIEKLLNRNSKLYIWGAATKGCMFLTHCANRGKLLDKIGFAVDLNPHKIGKFLPGSLVAIKSMEDFFRVAKDDDVLLISNSNYHEEILKELQRHRLDGIIVVTL